MNYSPFEDPPEYHESVATGQAKGDCRAPSCSAIVGLAIRAYGQTHTMDLPGKHLDLMLPRDLMPYECWKGFVVSDGRIVGREEAAVIAFEAGQTDRLYPRLLSDMIRQNVTGHTAPDELGQAKGDCRAPTTLDMEDVQEKLELWQEGIKAAISENAGIRIVQKTPSTHLAQGVSKGDRILAYSVKVESILKTIENEMKEITNQLHADEEG